MEVDSDKIFRIAIGEWNYWKSLTTLEKAVDDLFDMFVIDLIF